MPKQDSDKRNLGGATQRTQPSFAAKYLVDTGVVKPRVLDFGCGFGYDADHYGWEKYDPFYGPVKVEGPFETILCTQVLNAISGVHRRSAIEEIQNLLSETGTAYLCVARNLPKQGKVCALQRRQYYVQLGGDIESVYSDTKREIYTFNKRGQILDFTLGP